MCRGFGLQAPLSAIIAYFAGIVADGRSIHIGIVNVGRAYVVYRRIIGEVSSLPAAAAVPVAPIAVAIIDPSIVANIGPPVASVKDIGAVVPLPIRRSPKLANLRRLDPFSGYPVIAIIAIRPISRIPNISIIGTGRLGVDLKRRRRNVDGYRYLGECRY